MIICEKVNVGGFNTNCYIFGDDDTKEVVVVDPGNEAEKIFNITKKEGLNIKYILLTHGHFDHIGGLKELKELSGAKILIHQLDSEMLTDPVQNFSKFIGLKEGESIQIEADEFLEDGQTFNIGNKSFSIIHTPGHTRGGISVLFGKYLFSGDTLFRESIGRTDLPLANHSDILLSVEKLMKLENDVVVYPGHGEHTTIGHERKHNPFI